MGSNLQYKGFQEVITSWRKENNFNGNNEPSPEEIQDNWKRLMLASRGFR